jgi:hypothetical protein
MRQNILSGCDDKLIKYVFVLLGRLDNVICDGYFRMG